MKDVYFKLHIITGNWTIWLCRLKFDKVSNKLGMG